MRRPDGSKHFMLTAGHCTSTHPAMGGIVDASTLNSTQTAWTNDIGTSAGYINSLCVTTGNSCTRGERMYYRSPVVRGGRLGGCVYGGDSGGAVYKTTSAGARASGVLGGRSFFDGECAIHYTSIAYAQELFAAEVVLP